MSGERPADAEIRELFETAAQLWWIFVAIGSAWILFAIVIFRFDWVTVSAISILFGIVAIAAGIEEVAAASAQTHRSRWGRVARLVVAVALIAVGVVAFVHPGNTFAALAAVMSFYFVINGLLALVFAIALRDELTLWGVTALVGLVEILIGVWAAGDFGRRTILLVVWIGVAALSRGINAIVFGFQVRDVRPRQAPATAGVSGHVERGAPATVGGAS